MNSKQKTPYYMIDQGILEDGLRKLKAALDHSWPNYHIGYSYKTNALPWVIRFFQNNDCYAEVVSDDEYNLAKSIGAKKIIYNGIAKTHETFLDAVEKHAIVNIDSEYEIDWLDDVENGQAEVGIRVNFDLESKCPGHTQCGEEGERFGFCYENGELKRAIERIENKGAKVVGIHLHKSSRTRMPDIYRAIAETANEIKMKYDIRLKYVDIGGGFFGGLETKPQFPEYFDMIASILSQAFSPEETALIVEPGMALVGAAVDYVSTVLDVKKTTRNLFVCTDGSRIHIDPLMTKKDYFKDIIRIGEKKRSTVEKQIVAGFTCMEHDRLFMVMNSEEILPGDSIVYHKVGAYTMCLSPLFIKWYPDVYVKNGDQEIKVRNNWGTEEYKSKSIGE